jgi:hypothetical protein
MIRITAPHFCAGVIVEYGRITRAAPILRYMVGWSVERAIAYARGKGWKVEGLG